MKHGIVADASMQTSGSPAQELTSSTMSSEPTTNAKDENRRQASPARSFRSRMGTMLRRNSATLGFSRPTTPFRSDSKSSLRLSTDAPAPTQEAQTHVPSPVQETAEGETPSAPSAPAGPSTLSQEVTVSPETAPAVLTAEPQPTPEVSVQAPEPKADAAAQTSSAPAPAPEGPSVVEEVHPAPIAPAEQAQEAKPEAPAPEERRADTFAFGDEIETKPEEAAPSTPEPARVFVAEPESIPEPPKETKAEAIPEPYDHSFAWRDDTRSRSVSPKHSRSILVEGTPPHQMVSSPESITRSISPKASKGSIASYGRVIVDTPGGRVHVSFNPHEQGEDEPRRGRSRASSVRTYGDPFADPPNTMPEEPQHRMLSPIDSVAEPSETPRDLQDPNQVSTMPYIEEQTYTSMPGAVVMPLPPAETVILPQKQVREIPSAYSLQDRTNGPINHNPPETDERLPLLPRTMDHVAGTSKSAAYPDTFNEDTIVFPSAQRLWPTLVHSLHSLGWTEYHLPDSSIYYHHKAMRITTDINLRTQKKLEAVTEYLDRKLPEEVSLAPEGWELWLRDAESSKQGFAPLRNWVNHKAKVLSFDPPPAPEREADTSPDHMTDDDRLDKEYRYWAFVEGHPAHTILPENAHAEAMDALTWSYTDCLLPENQTTPPPFSPQECQELMGLLRSFENPAKANSIVHIRVVSRVLLRIAQWRQQNFRPDKPLPRDVSKGPLRPDRRLPFRRTVLDVIMSILCLGIPYLFMNRSRGHRIDEESGLQSAGPMLMIGACACLVSAVILSASVTFLTLPGLDDVARLAGMIAILFSASSMVSTVVALFRYKADVERTMVYVSGEGLMLISRRSIVMSLPLVFLAWAIAAFVTGITFYSFRGATITGRADVRVDFQDYTHWAMVGSLGGVGGVLMMSALLARR